MQSRRHLLTSFEQSFYYGGVAARHAWRAFLMTTIGCIAVPFAVATSEFIRLFIVVHILITSLMLMFTEGSLLLVSSIAAALKSSPKLKGIGDAVDRQLSYAYMDVNTVKNSNVFRQRADPPLRSTGSRASMGTLSTGESSIGGLLSAMFRSPSVPTFTPTTGDESTPASQASTAGVVSRQRLAEHNENASTEGRGDMEEERPPASRGVAFAVPADTSVAMSVDTEQTLLEERPSIYAGRVCQVTAPADSVIKKRIIMEKKILEARQCAMNYIDSLKVQLKAEFATGHTQVLMRDILDSMEPQEVPARDELLEAQHAPVRPNKLEDNAQVMVAAMNILQCIDPAFIDRCLDESFDPLVEELLGPVKNMMNRADRSFDE